MNTSEQINELATALAAAQATMVNPEKTKSAKIKSDKGSFEYRYADLADTLDGLRKTLAAHSLSFAQVTQLDGDAVTLLTRLMHGSGQWIEGVYPVCRTGAHQQMGGALTYARRYALFAMVGIAGEDDTDGNGVADAVGATKRPAPAAKPVEQSSAELRDQMLRSIAPMTDIAKFDAWKERHKPAFARLSEEDWGVVQAVAKSKRAELAAPRDPAHKAAFDMQAPSTSEVIDAETGEVSDGLETDALLVNYGGWVEDVETRLKAATEAERDTIWNDEVQPRLDMLFPPDRERLKKLMRDAP